MAGCHCNNYGAVAPFCTLQKKYSISYVKINNYLEKDFLFNDYNDLDYKFETDEWNNIIYDQIIKSLKYFNLKKISSFV